MKFNKIHADKVVFNKTMPIIGSILTISLPSDWVPSDGFGILAGDKDTKTTYVYIHGANGHLYSNFTEVKVNGVTYTGNVGSTNGYSDIDCNFTAGGTFIIEPIVLDTAVYSDKFNELGNARNQSIYSSAVAKLVLSTGEVFDLTDNSGKILEVVGDKGTVGVISTTNKNGLHYVESFMRNIPLKPLY